MESHTAARLVVAAMADSHAGHMLALCNPIARFTREGQDGDAVEWVPTLTEWQTYLWQLYSADVRAALELAGADGLVLLHVGDITWGTKHPYALMDITPDEQVDLAVYNLRPWARAKAVRLLHGTEAHVIPDGLVPTETRVAGKLKQAGVDAAAIYHERATVAGMVIDAAHHGPGESSRWWLQGNNARFYLRDRMDRDGAEGKPPARVYLRGHYHTWVHERMERRIWGKVYRSDLMVLPSYCGLTTFARRVSQSTPMIDNGLALLVIEGGDLADVVPRVTRLDLRTEESIG